MSNLPENVFFEPFNVSHIPKLNKSKQFFERKQFVFLNTLQLTALPFLVMYFLPLFIPNFLIFSA